MQMESLKELLVDELKDPLLGRKSNPQSTAEDD
jgi:hypothetical protein